MGSSWLHRALTPARRDKSARCTRLRVAKTPRLRSIAHAQQVARRRRPIKRARVAGMPVPPPEFSHIVRDLIPFNRFLGIQLVAAQDGHCRLELPFREEFIGDASRPALHGGVISTLIDTCGGFAVWTRIAIDDRV